MNMEANPTADELRELIRARHDRANHHVLWVANNGDVQVSPVPNDATPLGFQQSHPEMKLRLETFEAGNGYVGAEAAEDSDWINQLFDAVTREWSKAKDKAGVEYVDQF